MNAISALCVYCGSSNDVSPNYLQQARDLGRRAAEHGLGVVFGGGRVGMMGALADGALAAGGCLLWGLVQPALASHLWLSGESTHRLAERAWRVEPWYVEPLVWRAMEAQARPQWRWRDAAEAMHWSRRAVQVDRGKATLWSSVGQVHARLVNEIGRWPDAVETARQLNPRMAAPDAVLAGLLRLQALTVDTPETSAGVEEARSLLDAALQRNPYLRGRYPEVVEELGL